MVQLGFLTRKVNLDALLSARVCSRSILEASLMRPGNFGEKSKFHENLDFRVHAPDLCVNRDFSKTHKQTQQLYSWIGIDLPEGGKLLPCQTNSWILRYLHFSDPFTPIFDKPS